MKKYIYFLFVIFFIVSGCSRKNRIIAVFNNGTILQKELDLELERYPEQKRRDILSSIEQIEPILEDLAIKKISYLYAGETNIINLSEISNNIFNNYKHDLINYMFKKKTKKPEGKVKVSDIPKFSSTLKIKIIRLLCFPWMSGDEKDKIYKQARQIIKSFKSGTDFGKLADQYSSDPYNFKNGRLGFISISNFGPDVFNKIKKLAPSEVSDIITSEMGYHIFKVHQYKKDVRPIQINLSHILIKTNENGKERIKKVKELLSRGYDFSLAANEYTEDMSNFKSGDIPIFDFSRVYYGLADEAYNTDPGEISDIIETGFSLFILKTEKVNKPDKEKLKNLKKDKRYINRIKIIKTRYLQNIKKEEIRNKIIAQYKIMFNTSLLTNRNIKSNDIIVKVPEMDLMIPYKDCIPYISRPAGPAFHSGLKVKMDNIFKNLVFEKIAYDYALKEEFHKEEEFRLIMNAKLYNGIYQKVTEKIPFKSEGDEKALRAYYKKNVSRYYVAKREGNKSIRTKQNFKEAFSSVKRDYNKKNRIEAVNKWKSLFLKKYNFSIYFSRLPLKKNAVYYVKIGDTYFTRDKFKKAGKYYFKALKMAKDLTEIYIKLMLVSSELNDDKNLIKMTDKFQRLENINIDVLLKYLTVGQKEIRIKIIDMLGMKGDVIARRKLLDLYKKEDDINIMQSIVKALGMLHSNHAFLQLFDDLKKIEIRFKDYPQKEKEILKWNLIEAIGNIGNKAATDYFISLMNNSKDMNLKCIIAGSLGGFDDKKAVPVLEGLVKDKNEVWGVRTMAAESLRKLTGKTYKIKAGVEEAL